MTRPVGHPTDYKPEYCEKVIKLLNKGYSIAELARYFKVAIQTIYNWQDKHPEFLEAIKKGVGFSQGWWEKHGRQNIHNKDFNSTLWYMNMKNRFGWKDKAETTHNVKVTEQTEEKIRNAHTKY